MHDELKKHLDKSLERVEAAFFKSFEKEPGHDARKQKLIDRIEKNSEVLPAEALPVIWDKFEEILVNARNDDLLGAMEALTDACELAIKAIGPFSGASKTTP